MMRKMTSFRFRFPVLFLGMAWLAACGGGVTGGTETGNPTPVVGYAVADSIDTVTGLLSAEPDFSPTAWTEPRPAFRLARLFDLLISPACAGPSCVVTAICDDVAHLASFVKDFSGGCDNADGFVLEGKRYMSWFNMGENACSSPTSKPTFGQAIQGLGSRQIRSTDVIPADGTCGQPSTPLNYIFDDGARLEITQCGTLDYSNFMQPAPGEGSVNETMNLPLSHRVFFNPDGSTLYDHRLLTPEALFISLTKVSGQNRPNKTIHSGKVRVENALAQLAVDTDYQDVEWDYSQCRCYPIRGTVAFTATDTANGTTLGTGSVTFNKDQTGACRVVQAVFQGEELIVSLHNCRGH